MSDHGSVMFSGNIIAMLLRSSVMALPLAGCATLPTNGPTAGHIESEAKSARNTLGYHIVDITPDTVRSLSDNVDAANQLTDLTASDQPQRSDIIHKGDTLSIGIFEVGVALFGGSTMLANSISSQIDTPTANVQHMGVQVDDDGAVRLPYVGTITVAGMTADEVGRTIEHKLRGMSQSPQALVSIADSVSNSVYLSGAVARPGRIRLSAAHERLLDMLAIAGGPSVEIEDAELRLTRQDQTAHVRLADLHPEDPANIALVAGDRIEIVKNPRSFTVFGATDKVSQIPFGTPSLSLSEAVARAGGPSDMRANPRSVFLFRFEPGADGKDEKPVIYRLNMMNPQSYFLATRFALRDKDLIYFSNSAANPPAKFINLLNQLFSPVVTARLLTKNN